MHECIRDHWRPVCGGSHTIRLACGGPHTICVVCGLPHTTATDTPRGLILECRYES